MDAGCFYWEGDEGMNFLGAFIKKWGYICAPPISLKLSYNAGSQKNASIT